MSCCRWTMPLGRPVEPDEYIQNAISLRWVSVSARSPAKLGVGPPASRSDDRRPLAAAMGEIVEQDAAGVVGLRNRKTDFQGARAVRRHLVGDLATLVRSAHTLSPARASYRAMNNGDIA